MKIYGKKFDQIKYEIFKEGNYQKRSKFMEQLENIRKESAIYKPQPQYQSTSTKTT